MKHVLMSALAVAGVLAPLSLSAQIPAITVTGNTLVIACASPRLPSQAEVGRVLGIDNFSQTYAARAGLMVDVRHACLAGNSEIVATRAPDRPALVLVAMR